MVWHIIRGFGQLYIFGGHNIRHNRKRHTKSWPRWSFDLTLSNCLLFSIRLLIIIFSDLFITWKISEMLRYGLKMSTELESNLTAVERIIDYSDNPSEVTIYNTNYLS